MAKNAASEARHTRQLSEAQKQAILKAHLVDGVTRSHISGLAAKGELGIPAFTVDYRYVYTVIRRGREEFELENPQALARSTQDELTRLHGMNLTESRELGPKSTAGQRTRMAEYLAKTHKALEGVSAKTHTQPKATTENAQAQPEPAATPDVINHLLSGTPRQASPTEGKPTQHGKAGARTGSLTLARKPDAPSDAA